MSGAQGLGRARVKAPRGYNAPLLPKHMTQIAPNAKQPFCSLSVREQEKKPLSLGTAAQCADGAALCPGPWLRAVDSPWFPMHILQILPTHLSCPCCCGSCVLPGASSRDSLLAYATASPAFLITGLFSLPVLRAAVPWALPTP